MRITFAVLVLTALGSLGPAPASGQSVAMDEGTFSITMEGRSAGTETFAIRRIGMGADSRVIAQGQVQLSLPGGSLSMEPIMEASETLSLAGYQNKVSGTREEVFTLAGTNDQRFQGRTVSPEGEQVQEYRAASGTILLEEMVAHHYFLLGARLEGDSGAVPVIIPGQGRQLQLQYTITGNETLQLGGAPVEARKVRVEVAGSGRDVWFDVQGRVLRVEDSARSYRAERTARPG